VATGFVAGVVLVPGPLAGQPAATPAPADDAELARLYQEDQADRSPKAGAPIDWEKVSPRDRARESRVKELYAADRLRTGADYYHAAMVLQHAGTPEDYLLAHEFCVAALAQGEARAKWLAAATEDRYLMTINRPQRFATQFRSDGPDKPMRLYQVDPAVTDGLRRALDVPPLANAKAREAKMNEKKD
jgi:hypothetical protein